MKYLIVKTSSIGDIIQTFPVIQYLKERDPLCEIDWVVEEEYASLILAHPDISSVLTIATRKKISRFCPRRQIRAIRRIRKTVYDVVFDLQGNTKSAFVTGLCRGKKKVGFDFSSLPEWPNYFATNCRFSVSKSAPIQHRYLSVIQQFFGDSAPFEVKEVELKLTSQEREKLSAFKEGPRVMVAPSSFWDNKTLSVPMWVEFLKSVEGPFCFVWGTEKERIVAEKMCASFPGSVVLEKMTFPLWQNLMRKMKLVIATDSAALALCGTTSTPSFGVFGPTQAAVYNPQGRQRLFFQGSCPYKEAFPARCPKLRSCPTGACLKEVSMEEIKEAFNK